MVFEPHPEGVVVRVKAQPGARRNGLNGVQEGRLKVAVTQAPEKGKATVAVQETLAKALGVRKSQVELLSGATSPEKRFLLRGQSEAAMAERLASILSGG